MPSVTPTHEDVARLAYRLWEERGAPIGSPEVDWARAEEELSGHDPSGAPPVARAADPRSRARQRAQHNT